MGAIAARQAGHSLANHLAKDISGPEIRAALVLDRVQATNCRIRPVARGLVGSLTKLRRSRSVQWGDDDLDPAVQCAPGGGGVGGDRFAEATAHVGDAFSAGAIRNQNSGHSQRPFAA